MAALIRLYDYPYRRGQLSVQQRRQQAHLGEDVAEREIDVVVDRITH